MTLGDAGQDLKRPIDVLVGMARIHSQSQDRMAVRHGRVTRQPALETSAVQLDGEQRLLALVADPDGEDRRRMRCHVQSERLKSVPHPPRIHPQAFAMLGTLIVIPVLANGRPEALADPAPGGRTGVVASALVGALLMTAWDLVLDPILSGPAYGAWVWEGIGPAGAVPVHDYLGWAVTAFTILLAFQVLAGHGRPPVSRRATGTRCMPQSPPERPTSAQASAAATDGTRREVRAGCASAGAPLAVTAAVATRSNRRRYSAPTRDQTIGRV